MTCSWDTDQEIALKHDTVTNATFFLYTVLKTAYISDIKELCKSWMHCVKMSFFSIYQFKNYTFVIYKLNVIVKFVCVHTHAYLYYINQ